MAKPKPSPPLVEVALPLFDALPQFVVSAPAAPSAVPPARRSKPIPVIVRDENYCHRQGKRCGNGFIRCGRCKYRIWSCQEYWLSLSKPARHKRCPTHRRKEKNV